MIKLIAIDMDGTLLNHQKEIPEENIRAIRKAAEAGVKIVICTGRMLTGVLPYFEQLDFAGQDEYAILNNGCSTYKTSDWALVTYADLSSEDVAFLAEVSSQYPDIFLTLTDNSGFTVLEEEVPALVAYDASLVFTEAKPVTLESAMDSAPVFQAMYLGESAALTIFQEEKAEQLSQRFSTVRSQSYIFEAMPKGVTKASALAELAKLLGILPEEVMAIGDGNNDLEMIAFAGYGVAMGNATDAVKAIAKYQTSSCDEAGVAQAIERYVL